MKKLFVDVDCGVDDAQAIMMAFAVPDVQILGISCVQGNTSVENVCKNVLRVLKVCKHLEVRRSHTPYHNKMDISFVSCSDALSLNDFHTYFEITMLRVLAHSISSKYCAVFA